MEDTRAGSVLDFHDRTSEAASGDNSGCDHQRSNAGRLNIPARYLNPLRIDPAIVLREQ